MKLGAILLVVALVAILSPRAGARSNLLSPIDHTKQADINDKNLSYGDVSFDTISQPTRDEPPSPLIKGNVKLQGIDLNNVDLGTRDMSTVFLPILPKANFTAKRATVDKQNAPAGKQLDHATRKAPITNRQIRPFTPAGEEELKRQLNEPPSHAPH
jgi:hypothetical protein